MEAACANGESSRRDKLPFADIIVTAAKDLERLAALLLALPLGIDDKCKSFSAGRSFSELTFDVPKPSQQIRPMASVPFSPSTPRSPRSDISNDCLDEPSVFSASPPASPKLQFQFLGMETHYQSESGISSPPVDNEYRSEASDKLLLERPSLEQWDLRITWSEFDQHLLDDYVNQIKEKPALERDMTSVGNVFGVELSRLNTSGSGLKLRVLALQWVVSPLSIYRLVWDLLSMLFLIYDVVAVPLQVFDILSSGWMQAVVIFCCFFWMGDVIMSFRTAYYDGQMLQSQPSSIAIHYLRTCFFVDLVIIFVHWLNALFDNGVVQVLQLARFARLYKLVRFRRIIIERSNSNRVHLYLDCVDIAVLCAIAVHLISCGWYWLGERANGWTLEAHMQDANLFYSYFAASRWTIAQVSGRTDIELRTAPEYVYTVLACIFGLIIMSLMISSITNTMIELGGLNRDRAIKSRALNGFLKQNHVAAPLALRAKAVLATQQKILHNSEKEQEVLSILPRQIFSDLSLAIRGPLLMAHVLFRDLGREFPRMLRRVCADAVKMIFVSEEELAFAKGDPCTRMLFVSSGSLRYTWSKRKRECRSIESGAPGDFFGTVRRNSIKASRSQDSASDEEYVISRKEWVSEAALWVEWEHKGALRGSELSSLAALEVHEFINVVKLFKWARARSIIYARAFVQMLRALPKLSDVMDPMDGYFNLDEDELVTQTQTGLECGKSFILDEEP